MDARNLRRTASRAELSRLRNDRLQSDCENSAPLPVAPFACEAEARITRPSIDRPMKKRQPFRRVRREKWAAMRPNAPAEGAIHVTVHSRTGSSHRTSAGGHSPGITAGKL